MHVLTKGNIWRDLALAPRVLTATVAHELMQRSPRAEHRLSRARLRGLLSTLPAQHPSRRRLDREPGTDPALALRESPLTSKQELRERFDAWAATAEPERYFQTRTTGSTGQPTRMWFDERYMVSYFARYRCALRRYVPWLRPLSAERFDLATNLEFDLLELVQPNLGFSKYHVLNVRDSLDEVALQLLALLEQRRPAVLSGPPSLLLQLRALYLQGSFRPAFRPRVLLALAEELQERDRETLALFFRCPVVSIYGLTEVGGYVAEECPARKGFHVNSFDYHAEVLDERGHPVADGEEGEIVLTNLFHREVPIVRYRTGDFGALCRERCPCGSVQPRIAHLSGRRLTRFTRPDGSHFQPLYYFKSAIYALPIQQFQLVQRGARSLSFRYAGPEAIDAHPAAAELVATVRKLFGERAELELVRVPGFPLARKFQCFLNLYESGTSLEISPGPTCSPQPETAHANP
jgi:phenylacetate-CoA ligase